MTATPTPTNDEIASAGSPSGWPLRVPAHQRPDRPISELGCPAGHPLAISDGRSVWPVNARITRTVTLFCEAPGCRAARRWFPPPRDERSAP